MEPEQPKLSDEKLDDQSESPHNDSRHVDGNAVNESGRQLEQETSTQNQAWSPGQSSDYQAIEEITEEDNSELRERSLADD